MKHSLSDSLEFHLIPYPFKGLEGIFQTPSLIMLGCDNFNTPKTKQISLTQNYTI